MRIGLTYDLRDEYLAAGYDEDETAEFDSLQTIVALERAITVLGHVPDRVGNVRRLAARLSDGERWDLVFNIAEGLHGQSREAQVPALLEAFDVPYTFSDPLVCALTLNKAAAKHVVHDHGIATAPFCVVRGRGDVAEVARLRLDYPLFAKPLAEGSSKGIEARCRVRDADELRAICDQLLARYRQPVLVESYLPGREFTVGIVGTGDAARALAVMEVVLREGAEAGAYSYENKEHYERNVLYRLADDAESHAAAATALAVWRALDCRDGGRVDLRSDTTGTPQFLEVNPLAGLNPVRSDLPIMCRLAGIEYDALVGLLLDSALERVPAAATVPPREAASDSVRAWR